VVTDNDSAGVTPVQVLQELTHGLTLLLSTRVIGLTTRVVTTFVAHTDGVAVVVQAVSADHPFRTAFFNGSVTTDDVVVANAELPALLAMPRVYLGGRRCLVGLHGTTVNHN
jgi:hypothetical protein